MSPSERKQKLQELKLMVQQYGDREITRLEGERAFLQSVLNKSLGGLKAKDAEKAKSFVVADISDLVGL